MITDENTVLQSIITEMQHIPSDKERRSPEDVGNGLCRFYLDGWENTKELAPVLAKLFFLTAKKHKGSPEGMEQRLSLVGQEDMPGLREWLADYRQKGCPPVHHSRTYREAYQPHYRLLFTEYAGYMPILLKLQALLKKEGPVVVAIDGRCGSGKTRLAELLAEVFDAALFHMDDYYLPVSQRDKDWEKKAGANMDFPRFLQEVLKPIQEGKEARYRPYDCKNDRILQTEIFFPKKINIVEGSYSHHPCLKGQYDLKIFLTCSKKVQALRLQKREGGYYEAFKERWIPLEEQYIRESNVEESAHLAIDTTNI